MYYMPASILTVSVWNRFTFTYARISKYFNPIKPSNAYFKMFIGSRTHLLSYFSHYSKFKMGKNYQMARTDTNFWEDKFKHVILQTRVSKHSFLSNRPSWLYEGNHCFCFLLLCKQGGNLSGNNEQWHLPVIMSRFIYPRDNEFGDDSHLGEFLCLASLLITYFLTHTLTQPVRRGPTLQEKTDASSEHLPHARFKSQHCGIQHTIPWPQLAVAFWGNR